jgi:arginine/lysine/ornithine decarboxylase
LPELPDLDNLFAPQGVIEQAQQLAAKTFAADHTWFLANGSTCGIIAAILATCQPGDKIILPRNVHQSIISGLILSGAVPVFIMPEYDRVLHLAHGVTPDTIAQALAKHPDAKAVLIVYPTYYGVCSDIQSIVSITHRHHVPLIVDEAHGAHFHFHPDLPIAAMAAGADIAIQSTHKTLSALTQASMLHLQGDRVDPDRIQRSLALVQSTSPNYLLLASLDAARDQMATIGQTLLTQTLELADQARQPLQTIPHIRTLEATAVSPGFYALDRTRLTITMAALGLDGFTADAILSDTYHVVCELPSLEHLTFIFSIGTTTADRDRLVTSIRQLADRPPQTHAPIALPIQAAFGQPQLSPQLSPREAFFAKATLVPIAQAVGLISAELICPYPPGIPVLLPGEVITAEAINFLQTVQQSGGIISGCSDAALQTVRVIDPEGTGAKRQEPPQ